MFDVDPMHFEAQAEIYASARPEYPPELWTTLRDRGFLRPGLRALDLGAGTGQATGPLLAAGLRVTAVEPGPRLAGQLAASHPAASVVVARAEELDLRDATFDLAVAATSIHWMDLDVLLPRLHRLLTPSGHLLVWRSVFGAPSFTTPFRDRVAQIVAARRSAARRSTAADAEDLAATAAALTRTGHFSVESTFSYSWSITLDAEQVHRLFSTFSNWSTTEVEQAAQAVRDLGGHVVEHYSSWLIALDREPLTRPTASDRIEPR